MADLEYSDSIERISGLLADVEADSVELQESVGEIIIQKEEHSNGSPTIKGTGIRVEDVACAYEQSGYEPDEITELHPELSLSDVHYVLGYYYEHINDL